MDATELAWRLALPCDADTHHLLHALAPLVRALPNTLRTYRTDDEQKTVSGAHVLPALVCGDRGEPARLADCHLDALDVLRHLPEAERPLVADVLARHLVQDADLLPAWVTRDLLVELIRNAPVSGAHRWAGLWPVLETYVSHEMGRADLTDKEVKVLVGHLRRYARSFTRSQDRLSQLLREAGSSRVWAAVDHGSGREVLEEARGLLHDIPAGERTPEAVIGLLRLARELGEGDWLTEHAEPLLLGLAPNELWRLRATDVDALMPVVRDAGLLSALQAVEAIWRRPQARTTPSP
ncbi:hypothetical protein [Streptomyces sp. RerS4]|uniref:hypothetical protein n=1 Tax=Streptomyces sp. RerS4 TaxID=2942449 RepID=UPI00201C2F81|nr:hypothetical protein [Streptomyces sp. RerS4]UQX04023.1 hypothetical protein M4D82_28585 [Streptomyces sp. RerS4]